MTQIELFQYDQINETDRVYIQDRTIEIKALVKRSAQDIIDIGLKLIEVKERLPHGQWGKWLDSEFGWAEKTARNFTNVAKRFKSVTVTDLNFAHKVLYLLAAPSTPDEAIDEAIDRAKNGEAITHKTAKGIVTSHKEKDAAAMEDDESLPGLVNSTLFECPECEQTFNSEVWHCLFCNHHWQLNQRDCPNCYKDKLDEKETTDIKRIKRDAPQVFEQVMTGEITITEAKKKDKAMSREKKLGQLTQDRDIAIEAATGKTPSLYVGSAENMKEVKSGTVDIIITSPHYNLGSAHWPMGGDGRKPRDDGIGYDKADDTKPEAEYQDEQIRCLIEMYRVSKSGASLFYNHKVRNRNNEAIFPHQWLLRAANPWIVRQEIIWDRTSTHNHNPEYFYPEDERIFWMVKGEKPSLYNPSVGLSTVWRFFGPVPNTGHPAPFSDELPRRCLQAIGGNNLTVLDPFAGSCTTLSVALSEFGHECIGYDLSEDYLKAARVTNGWGIKKI